MKIFIKKLFDLPELLLDLFFDPSKFLSSNGKLSKDFVIKSYLSKNLWAKHERRRTHKTKILQDAVSQSAGRRRPIKRTKCWKILQKNYLDQIPFNLSCIRQEFDGGRGQTSASRKRPKRATVMALTAVQAKRQFARRKSRCFSLIFLSKTKMD